MKKVLTLLSAMLASAQLLSAETAIPEQFRNILGEGDNYASLTLHWGDNVALDNLVSAVRFEDNVSVSDIISSALAGDSRFYALKDGNGTTVAYGFDTNGDHSAAVSIDGTQLTLVNGIATAEIDYASATGSSAYDHWAINSDTGEWKTFVNGTLVDTSTSVASGDIIELEYTAPETSKPADKAYSFYLRPDDEMGVWMQEDIVFDTKDGKMQYFPIIATTIESTDLYGAGIGGEIYEIDGETTTNRYTTYVANGTKGGSSCRISMSSPGNAIIKLYLNIRKDWDNSGKLTVKRIYGDVPSKVTSVIANPVSAIYLDGIEQGGTIEVDNMGIAIITPLYEPATPDFSGYNAIFEDESVANIYKNVNSIVAHKAGTTKLTIESLDGNASATYWVHVKDVDTTKPTDEYQDGVIWLNEEWFGHTSGSLNYLNADGSILYRAYGGQNNNMAFGCTSQFGTIYADKLIIMSKQAWDGGDTRPLKSGGRVVIADAKTMKHIAAFDEIGGDGRTCVGVSPSKVYLGHSKGIRVLDIENMQLAEEDIPGTAADRMGQIGDMVKSGKYVFATNLRIGVLIIDTETDKVVKTIPATNIQTVAQSADGRVWYANPNTITPIDPETLEEGETYTIPGSITCSSGSWRKGNLLSSTVSNTLLWGSGTFYRWDLDEVSDPATLTPVYTHTSKIDDISYGGAYATPGYDDRTDTYMFASMPGFGTSALQNYYHFIDATTGEVKSRIKLPEYWWFPAMPIFPDKHNPVVNLDEVNLSINDEPIVIDLNEYLDDPDNFNKNISVTIADDVAARSTSVCEATLDGRTLTIAPKTSGDQTLALALESNGRVVNHEIAVSVKSTSQIENTIVNHGQISCDGTTIYLTNMSGTIATLYTLNGIAVTSISADSDYTEITPSVPAGIYVLRANNGKTAKIIIK